MAAATIDDFLTDGFVDVPRIIKAQKETEFFPGLLDELHSIRRRDFSLFDSQGRIYLDSAATSQVPRSVLDAIHEYRTGNIRGSTHSSNSAEAIYATNNYEAAKEKLRAFLNANDYHIAFTSGTTASSNAIAARFDFKTGDLLILTDAEHHSQMLTARNFADSAGVQVRYVPVDKEGRLNLDHLKDIVAEHEAVHPEGRRLMYLVHASNVTGVINPVKDVKRILGQKGILYLDMAQSAGHMPIDLDELGVDAAGLSAHKMYGPEGIGALLIKRSSDHYFNNKISGGSAIQLVTKDVTIPEASPARFEPGTQNIEGAIEWRLALDYILKIGMEKIEMHDRELGEFFLRELKKIPGVEIYGPKDFKERLGVITFNIGNSHTNYGTVARSLNSCGISVRDGCFCAHPLMATMLGVSEDELKIFIEKSQEGIPKHELLLPGAVRFSFSFYNNLMDAYHAVAAVREIAARQATR